MVALLTTLTGRSFSSGTVLGLALTDVVLELTDLGGAGGHHEVLQIQGVDHIRRGQALRLQQGGIQVNPDLALLAPVGIGHGGPGDGDELRPQEVQSDVVQVLLQRPGPERASWRIGTVEAL